MRSRIRIVKPKRVDEANHEANESKKSAEPRAGKIVSTIKGWIAESQERKRNQRRSLPLITAVVLITFVAALAQSPTQPTARPVTAEKSAIKVTIATVASSLGPPTDHYKAGDQIPVTITMTNTSPAEVSTCVSSDLYQDLPKLTRDGKEVPYMNWQSYERLNAARNHVCENENLPESVLLKPNKAQMVDWFILADGATPNGAEAWYDPLPPGKYELTMQRRLACCDGPMVESNKTSFEVVP
jgi:hypothetical protein